MSNSIRPIALAACALAVALGGAIPLGAQSATLEGFVLSSSSGRRLGGVLVAVESGPRTKSDSDGAYRLEGIEPGERRIALVAPGCQVTMANVGFWPGEEKSLAFEVAFDPGVARQLTLRRRSSGKVVTAEEIEAMRAPTFLDVISRLAPGMVRAFPNQPGGAPVAGGRSPVGLSETVPPAVVLDGARLGASGFQVLQDINPADVAWLEVLQGASGGWEVGTGGSGGLLRIHTKRGRQMDALVLEPERCEIPGWKSRP
ncbi:MAG TPA: TonB-dependent receptor [Longimicrobiales bacterium]|nr:TonB-dependent receptor [Longimicrobiales bacterium]